VADFAAHRVEGLRCARERPGVGHRRLAARLRLPEFQGDDRLARRPGQAAGGLEACNVGDRFHIDADDLELRLAGEKRDVVGDRQTGFVAAGDQIFDRNAALLERAVQMDHHAAALTGERDRSGMERQRPVLGQGDEAALAADITHAVRPRHAEIGLGNGGGERAAVLRALRVAGLAETRGKYSRTASTCRGAAAQNVGHVRRRHQHDEMIGWLGQ